MFNYIKVSFPETTTEPSYIYAATIYQNRYQHELAVLKFRDWGVAYDSVAAGSPVSMTVYGSTEKRNFYGYVHHIKPDRSPGKHFTEVTVISPSFVMKQEKQDVFINMSADAIILQKAKEHGFACLTVPHPRIYPQISQAGHTDWEFMVRLAKQCGYSLRTQNTELYFQPMLNDYTNYRAQASKFTMRPEYDPAGTTIYSFKPLIGETLEFENTFKAAVAISGVSKDDTLVSITEQNRNRKTRRKSKVEFFDRYATDVVITDAATAAYEAKAAEDRNVFPYRATVTVLGEPNLRPDAPVYLEGVGADYSGYWTILGVEHNIVESERNNQIYTSTLYVGTDSLGLASTWQDGKTIVEPDYTPIRTVIPNVRQTVTVPKTKLVISSPNAVAKPTGEFGSINNRNKPDINNKPYTPPVWRTDTPTLNDVKKVTTASPAIISRLNKKAVFE